MGKKILVPIDGSEHSFKAIDLTAELAGEGDKVTLLNVVGRADMSEALKQFAKVEHIQSPPEWEYEQLVASGVLEAGQERAREHGLKSVHTEVATGDPAKAIVDAAASSKASVVVMGSRGVGALKGLAFGSVSQKVSHAAPCSVVAVS